MVNRIAKMSKKLQEAIDLACDVSGHDFDEAGVCYENDSDYIIEFKQGNYDHMDQVLVNKKNGKCTLKRYQVPAETSEN